MKNGSITTNFSFAGQQTVEDLLNSINGSKTGVLARINAAGNGIDIVNATQGTSLTITENGGTTGSQLGVLSTVATTALSSLNNGNGVHTVTGSDFKVNRKDGTNFSVDVDGAQTIQDVINAINAADGGAGVTASFSTTTGGLLLTDSTGGAGPLSVSTVGGSQAASDLGLLRPATGNVLSAENVNPVASKSMFANLIKLRDALQTSNQSAITTAAGGLEADHDRVVLVRGSAGAQMQGLESRKTQLEDEKIATQQMLSNLQDTDFASAVTQFQQLQTALQANYQTTAKILHMSLLDFLG